jgi:hypothetical protein
MTNPSKAFVGSRTTLATRERVFETDDAIVVETTDQYELSRKHVLFEDILLITFHREIGWTFVMLQIAIIAFVGIVGGLMFAANAPARAVAIAGAFALPSAIAIVVRLIFKVDVVSVFGRRSRAAIPFSFRKKRARELYGHLCARTRQTRRGPEEVTPQPQSAE